MYGSAVVSIALSGKRERFLNSVNTTEQGRANVFFGIIHEIDNHWWGRKRRIALARLQRFAANSSNHSMLLALADPAGNMGFYSRWAKEALAYNEI
jgi:hypothetical protein